MKPLNFISCDSYLDNYRHRHSAIRFVTPAQRHRREETAILAKRTAVYAEAKARHPERWSGEIRNWEPVQEVWLNPEKSVTTNTALVRNAA